VLDSETATDAVDTLDRRPDVKLLFTDVVMPEVNGKKLADEAVRRRPGLKVLFTTGYTPNAVVHGGVLDPGVRFLSKPFTLEQIAAKVRDALDNDPVR
jgi:DNA-binding NtrC family response regulator